MIPIEQQVASPELCILIEGRVVAVRGDYQRTRFKWNWNYRKNRWQLSRYGGGSRWYPAFSVPELLVALQTYGTINLKSYYDGKCEARRGDDRAEASTAADSLAKLWVQIHSTDTEEST
jgi:hypothetical protein